MMWYEVLWQKLKRLWDRQPDITVHVLRRMPKVQPEPFSMKGLIMQSDDSPRKISEGGTSKHVTIPSKFVPYLSDFHYCARFEAQGKTGLIFVCEGKKIGCS